MNSKFMCTFLTVPGWNGSGPGHWQTIWEQRDPAFVRVEQADWVKPRRPDWIERIAQTLRSSARLVILVAHSLGCIAVAHWAAAGETSGVAAAFLVAPPDLDTLSPCPAALAGFGPVPRARLPFPSVLVASETDPYMTPAAAHSLARSWGSDFVNAGPCGHINVDSGHGLWKQGRDLLSRFTSQRVPA